MSAPSPHYRIGEAARRSGVSAANIRFYEREQLLPRAVRGDNQYRFYTDEDVHRLRFIRLCRAMDMSLDEVRTLVEIRPDAPQQAHRACETLDTHIGHVRERLRELQTLEQELQRLRQHCAGPHGACEVIEALHAQADRQALEELPQPARHRHV